MLQTFRCELYYRCKRGKREVCGKDGPLLKIRSDRHKVTPPPPRIESSCWGRNSIGEEGKGRLKKGRKGREWKDIKLVATLYTTVCIGR